MLILEIYRSILFLKVKCLDEIQNKTTELHWTLGSENKAEILSAFAFNAILV